MTLAEHSSATVFRPMPALLLALSVLIGLSATASAQSSDLQALQQERLEYVAGLRQQRVISRFTQLPDGSQCFVEIGPQFDRLPFDKKVEAMSVPWTYCAARTSSTAVQMPIMAPFGNGFRQIGLFHKDGLSMF